MNERELIMSASIWVTAAICFLVGIEFYIFASRATALVLGVLSASRWLENILIPSQHHAHFMVKFRRETVYSPCCLS
jgi:uncharacterized membrane protein YhiD involved in acid resistance